MLSGPFPWILETVGDGESKDDGLPCPVSVPSDLASQSRKFIGLEQCKTVGQP